MEGIDLKSVDKLYKQAEKDLKTSFFSFKFNPDYLSAVVNFTDAGKGYRKHGKFKESIIAFDRAIQCNKKLHESYAESQNWLEIAEIYTFNLDDWANGFNSLKKASFSSKLTGRIHSGIRVYQDFASRLFGTNRFEPALQVFKEAYNDSKEHLHEEIIRVYLDEISNNLVDLYCQLEKFKDAIVFLDSHITLQKTFDKKAKISKNYVKMAMLMIITNEAYMVDKIINEMYSVYEQSCGDDIEDTRELLKAYNECNKQKFNYGITYAFSLFSNNLLKALKKAFEKRLAEHVTMENTISQNVDRNSEPVMVDLNETKDTELKMPEEEPPRDIAEDYL
jgi:tetratricopeptide (TPR) repeat protein